MVVCASDKRAVISERMQKARAKHSRLLKLMVTILTGCLLYVVGDLITMFPLYQQGIFGSKRKPFELRRNNQKRFNDRYGRPTLASCWPPALVRIGSLSSAT